ncbi:hypothetical protein ACO0QE_003795 [Hanseniaspora vineae]
MDQDWKELSRTFRLENKNIKSRLLSILEDYQYIKETIEPTFCNYKIVPNERCGIWYYPPEKYKKTCYFKSTDGHTNIWDFSHRRLNFHLLEDIFTDGGVVIIDSTRRGKKLPDSLSKTIPIWCAVLNCIINGGVDELGNHKSSINSEMAEKYLFLPPNTVSSTERLQILAKIPSLVANCIKYVPNVRTILLEKISTHYKRWDKLKNKEIILRPIWVHPGSKHNIDPFTGEIVPWEGFSDNHSETGETPTVLTVCCCSCSYQCQDGTNKKCGYTYVQGAADDHELWSNGLEAVDFWANRDYFSTIENTDAEINSYIVKNIMGKRNVQKQELKFEKITEQIYIGISGPAGAMPKDFKLWIRCGAEGETSMASEEEKENCDSRIIQFYPGLKSNEKKSGKNLRVALIEIVPLIENILFDPSGASEPVNQVLITCDTGTDISAGIALATIAKTMSSGPINKVTIRQQLTQMINKCTQFQINPSRATLNSVNSFLM